MHTDNFEGSRKESSIRICLFFTYGISLKKWDELGILDREILLYKELAQNGVEVAFFTYGESSDLAYSNKFPWIKIIPAYSLTKKCKNRKIAFLQSLWLPFKFRKVLSRYNILKTNQMWGAWVPLVAKWIVHSKLLVRCGFEHYYTLVADKSSAFTKFWFYRLSSLLYMSADHIILTADNVARFVIRTFGLSKRKITVYSNLVDTELFSDKESNEIIDNRVLFVGRLNKQKNLFALVDGCRKAGVGLDLIGMGELQKELVSYSNDINADVRFMGVYPNRKLCDLIIKYLIVILPSFYEGNPKTLLEAMSCGRAVIGSDVDGIRELIKDGENGVLCGLDSKAIAKAILRLIGDRELCKRIGQNARKYVLEHCSIDKIVKKELDVYNSILEG